VKEGLEIIPVDHVDEVLARALVEPLQPIEWAEEDEHAAEPPVHPAAGSGEAAVRH
jgi:ATP-dependent Lon protease